MASVVARKPHSSCKNSPTKRRSSGTNHISLDTSQLSIRTNSYDYTPSPSSLASTSTIDHSPKDRPRILSSTLKNEHSHVPMKRRSRFAKLYHHTQLVNRQYMFTMSNILCKMQKEILRLRRRTHRVEQSVIKQAKTIQPIIRIPRLTKDQLLTICTYSDEGISEENETISDNNNNHITTVEHTKSKTTKSIKRLKEKHRNRKNSSEKLRSIWVNNRQKPIDPKKYCSICYHEFSKRSNYMIHVRNIHKGILPPSIDEQDQSLLEMNEQNFDQHRQNDTTNDQSVVTFDEETEPLKTLTNQWNMAEGRLRSRTTTKLCRDSRRRLKVKCNICNKFYRSDYMKKHKRRAHPGQDMLLTLSEMNIHSNQSETTSDKDIDQFHLSNENPTSTEALHVVRTPNTPATITIAEMDTDDVPISFRSDSNRSIVIAVTCLESYQIELVDKFLEKFSSCVCQATSIDSQTTHLITNDEANPLRSPLSMKLIEAIAHHCYCVSYRWISDCIQYDRILDETKYEIEGDDTDIHPHGGPCRSRLILNRHSLFHNICFMVKCTENADIRMTNERLEDLITTCGGQIITCVTQRLLDKYQIIVLCDMSYVSERRHNYDQCRQLGIHFVSSDWVLESILEYRRKPFSLFEEEPS